MERFAVSREAPLLAVAVDEDGGDADYDGDTAEDEQ